MRQLSNETQKAKSPPDAEAGVIWGIAPIYKVYLGGEAQLIGTGFWITEAGHLITA
jgi:hypothetical protein